MNLQENIYRIQSLITEDKEKVIKTMINKHGLYDTIKMMGNYHKIEPYLKEIDKVNFIKEKVYELNNGRSIHLSVIDGDIIYYGEEDGEEHQIEWLGKDSVTVKTYGDNMNYIGTFNVNYENLPSQIIDKLFEILVNW
jgi:hypothetical protein